MPKQLWTKSANDEQALDGSTYDRWYPMPHVEDVAPPTGALFLARGGTTHRGASTRRGAQPPRPQSVVRAGGRHSGGGGGKGRGIIVASMAAARSAIDLHNAPMV